MHFQGNIFQDLKEKKVLDKDGKVDALGPYGKSKLTGMEVNAYFKKNRVSDPKVKKAVEVALDLGGSHSVATKEIAKFYGNKILKSKEVQKALKFANESFVLNQELNQIHESYLTEKNLMPAIQKIVADKSAAKVGGVMLDMFTASVIAKAYDQVNDSNKAKMEKANINILVKLAHKVMGMKEDLDEGKYAKYSDLLIKKAKLMKAGKDASMVDKEISKELKKLGIKEELEEKTVKGTLGGKVPIQATGDAIGKIFKTKDKKEIDGIANLMNMTSLKVLQSMMKQNPKGFKRMTAKMGELPAMEQVEEGAVSAAQRAAIAISKKEKAGKPGYDKEGKSLKNKKEETIKEGTWKVPDSARELAVLVDMLAKPYPATKPADVNKFMDMIPVGDDMLYDDLDAISYEKTGKMDRDGYPELKRPLVKMKKFDKVFVNVIAGEALQKEKWIRGKTSGNKFIMTHHSFGPMESVEEKVMRKKGNIKRGKMMKLDMSLDKKQSVMDAYRQMWEDTLDEEVADITVDPKNKINSGQQQGYHGMEIAKQARRMGLKSAVMHKHVRIKGSKKSVNDFLRLVIGKSRYGDPTEKDMSTPQVDKMLTKGLK